MEEATFAEGCFWCVEETYRELDGVLNTEVGYTGGHTDKPCYKDVCTGTTGHAEAVHISFNPKQISYKQLLHIFFQSHNPTTLNRQGADVGSQYRSAIFTHSEKQAREAEEVKEIYQKKEFYSGKVVTEITKASTFFRAEEYHQQYIFKKKGRG